MENRRKVTFPISTFMKKDTRQTKSFEMGYTLWNRNCTAGLKNFQLSKHFIFNFLFIIFCWFMLDPWENRALSRELE